MRATDVFPSSYYKAADINGSGLVLTIRGVKTEEMPNGKPRRCLSFEEGEKRLPLNRTNFVRVAELTGEDDDERWVGKRIRLVRDRVSFKGELVDAVRVADAGIPF